MKYFVIILSICLGLFIPGYSAHAGKSGDHHSHEVELPTVVVTQWTDSMELFMEYPAMLQSKPGKFIIHLTILKDFQPVREGMVTLTFRHQSGKSFQFKKDTLLREGIFTPKLHLDLTGKYDFTLEYQGLQLSESFRIDDFEVYDSVQNIPSESESEGDEISFLKEQQWKVEFQTASTQLKPMKVSIHVIGEVLPRQSSYAEITSPVEGFLQLGDNQSLVFPGSSIKKGQILAILSPPLGADNSWLDLKMDYEQAKAEYERAQRLIKKNAISNRQFEIIKNNYFIQKSGFEQFSQSGNSELFHFRAPIDGIVSEVTVLPGQKVTAGQKLMTIVDPDLVWLSVKVFETDYYRMKTPKGLTIEIPGLESSISYEGDKVRLLSMGNMLDTSSRTIPILFEIDNADHLLKIGQTLQVDLFSGDETLLLNIPKSAIFDDDTRQVVFIQKEGESFEKRIVETGGSYKGLIAILSGLKEGERVVTKGGYLVKLASTTVAIGHSHTH